tara:strand:- start:136 stop:318 length:183 start_codon:yes stop_codon:yes gene_type:complete
MDNEPPSTLYNIQGRYTNSIKEFKKYMKNELKFYQNMSDLAPKYTPKRRNILDNRLKIPA